MLAVILAAGKGTRLQSVNVCSSKCLLPINGISMLGKKIKQLAQSEYIDKIIIVIRKEQTEIPQLMGNQYMNVPISFAFQEEGKNGIVNALYSIKEIYELGHTDVLLNLGDEFYENLDYDDLIWMYRKKKCMISPVIIHTSRIEQIKANYSVKLEKDLRIVDVIEKPKEVFNHYIGCGTVMISSELLIAFSNKYNNCFNGAELIDWMKFAIENQMNCLAYEATGGYVNLNGVKDLEYIYQSACDTNEKLIAYSYCQNDEVPNDCNWVLLGRPNDFSRVYVLNATRKLQGYGQVGNLWLWKKEFTNQSIMNKYQKNYKIERDIINPSEYMIFLGMQGYVNTSGLYYGNKTSDFVADNKIFV